MPDSDMLDEPEEDDTGELMHTVTRATEKLRETLSQFGIDAHVGSAICGPVITCYEVQPAPGVKVSKITSLENDLALAMKAKSIRIVAPIPGRDAVGIELPNEQRRLVTFSELIHAPDYQKNSKRMRLMLSLGQTLSGETFADDMAEMPHLLVAGATGSGKSVCINTILLSLLFRFKPNEMKLVLVDPKHVELVPYHNLPHLLVPVLNEPGKVPDALEWLIGEMERRYKYFARLGVRNISMYNKKRQTDTRELHVQIGSMQKKLPAYLTYIVLVVDELADLMMVAADEIERKIIRLAQLARAAGIHMVLATQRPSTNVITGLIKANIPARIAFRTTSNIDSRVIIDEPGGEKLLGKGDMLYKSPSFSRTMRIQGAFVSEEEVRRVTNFIREQREPHYVDLGTIRDSSDAAGLEMDEKFDDAIRAVLESGQASASYLQRRLQVGYARAARLVDLMEAHGIVGPKRGAKPRDILVDDWPPEQNEI
jgi:S-DNA-T family DNA segregation ATPase FtsK/SpoIIIE